MQYKKIICLLSLIPTVAFSHITDTCPTIQEIKNNQLKNFIVYDIDNGIPVDETLFSYFQSAVQKFDLAEWMADAPEGEAHCYYSHDGNDPSYLGVFLAKTSYGVDTSSNSWEDKGDWTWHCTKNIAECRFLIG